MKPYKYTRELLEPIVAQSTSVADVVRHLGLRPNGGAHSHLCRVIKQLELDTSHFRRTNPGARRLRLPATAILVANRLSGRREKPPMLRRALIEIGVPYECAICGNAASWLDAPLTLEVDHMDGDLYNNSPSNLRFLCPNCHRQTPNFAGRSRGKYTQGQLLLAP
jgi:5-methylcytosine-specific restriction endonuclease McrA